MDINLIYQACPFCKMFSDKVDELEMNIIQLKRNIDLLASCKQISNKQISILEKRLSTTQTTKIKFIDGERVQNTKITIKNLNKEVDKLSKIIKVKDNLIAEFQQRDNETISTQDNMLAATADEINQSEKTQPSENLGCQLKII